MRGKRRVTRVASLAPSIHGTQNGQNGDPGGTLPRQKLLLLPVFPKESSLLYRGVIGTRSLATLAAGFHQGVPPAVLKASPTDDLRLG